MDIKKQHVIEETEDIEEKTRRRGETVRHLLTEAVYALGGLLAGGVILPFGAMPFGFALLGASGKHTVAVFVGLCLSLLGNGTPWVFLGAYSLTLALRALLTVTTNSSAEAVGKDVTLGQFVEGLFSEHISLRIISAAMGAFAIGLYRMFVGGFLYYDLFGAIISITVAALGAFLWYALPNIGSGTVPTGIKGVWQTVAIVSFVSAVVYGLSDNRFYGISLSALACMLAVLLITRKRGTAYGALLAIFAGLCVSVTYAPLFVFSAVAYGFLYTVSPLLASFSSFAVGMAWGVYTDGISSVTTLLPALLAANFLFFTVEKLFISDEPSLAETVERERETVVCPSPTGAEVAIARLDDTARRIKTLCEGLSSLSGMLLYAEATRAAEATASEVCRDALRSGALSLEIGQLGDASDVLNEIDFASAYMADPARTEAVALDYRALSDYLSGIMVSNEKEYSVDVVLGERVKATLEKKFSATFGVNVFGERRQRIMISCSDARLFERNKMQIRRCIVDACEFSVDGGEMIEVGSDTYLAFNRTAALDAVFAGRKRNAADEKEFCGDSFGTVRASDDGKLFAFISDGMGSGKEAAITSGLCSLFLQKLLPINVFGDDCVGATLELLNSFLRSRNGAGVGESLATIDLGVLDFVECRATFYKSGAAPTYVFRDGSLFKLRSRTVPIGIVKELDAGRINMELLPGDVIVMVSDGVTQGREECPELFELLRSRLLTHTADELADAVINYANDCGCTDDVSVVVIKITDRNAIMNDAQAS